MRSFPETQRRQIQQHPAKSCQPGTIDVSTEVILTEAASCSPVYGRLIRNNPRTIQ